MASQQLAEAGKDVVVAAAGGGALYLHSSWQDAVSDLILIFTLALLVLRIAYLLWQWVRGKKPD